MTDTDRLAEIREYWSRYEYGDAKWLLSQLDTATAERDQARAAILAHGTNPAGFDWGVLGQIDDLTADLAAARFAGAAMEAACRNVMDERDKLRATVCQTPSANSCARQWESDHQRAALLRHGLADEFNGGCDASGERAETQEGC